MRNIVKCEGFFLGEKGFISLFTHTYTSSQWQKFLLAFAWGSKMQFQYKPCTGWIMGNLWEPAVSPISAQNNLDYWFQENKFYYILCNLCNSLCFIHQCSLSWAVCLFPLCLTPSKQENPEVVSLPDLSLGGFPLGNAPGEFLEQHLPLTYEFLLASGIFPLLPVPAGKFLVNLAPVWTLQAD